MATERFFEVQTYKVRAETRGFTNRRVEARVIEIDGGQLDGAEANYPSKAVLSFRSDWNDWNSQPVGYWNWGKLELAGWFGETEFARWYDLLRSEKPLKLNFLHRDEQAGNGNYVDRIGLGSSSEPLGEGPTDTST
jgi:hypothetical protein